MMKSLKSITQFKTLIILVVLLSASGSGIHLRKAHGQIQPEINYLVVVKENASDPTRSDVYLQDPATGQEIFYITLLDVYRSQYHNAEFHNGSLYIIHRTGGDAGYQNNPDWMDDLWRYNQQEPAVRLFAARGLDFRVAEDESLIAITTYDESLATYTVTFTDRTGNVLNVTDMSQFGDNPNVSPVLWGHASFWLSIGAGPGIQQFVKIDTTNFQPTGFDVSMLPISMRDYALNPTREMIAFSDYPVMFDADSQQIFEQSGATVTLSVYDLNTQMQLPIATSIVKGFAPRWLDETTLEYDDPNGEDRITQSIP